MLPIRSSSAFRRGGRATPLISTLASSSRASHASLRIPSYTLDRSGRTSSGVTSSRALHVSTSQLKDKRWVNAAAEEEEAKKAEEEEGKKNKDGEEAVKSEEKKSPEEQGKKGEGEAAESSKAAQDRASKAAESSKSVTAESTSSTMTSASTSSSSASSADSGSSAPSTGREIAKVNVPDVFPRVLALPITLRPLFPTFYKAVTITHPPVIKAIRELLAHGQPYIGAFLFKDSESDADVITSVDQVHPVGVFAQITSTFEPPEKARGKDGKDKDGKDIKGDPAEPKALTVVLYPHRRIRIDELVLDTKQGESVPIAKVVEEVQKGELDDEGEVSSFERDVPSVDAVREELGTPPAERDTSGEWPFELTAGLNSFAESEAVDTSEAPRKPLSQIGFIHHLVPDISLADVSNCQIEPYRKDTQMIRALMAELISSFKDLAQLAPIFRDQSPLLSPLALP